MRTRHRGVPYGAPLCFFFYIVPVQRRHLLLASNRIHTVINQGAIAAP